MRVSACVIQDLETHRRACNDAWGAISGQADELRPVCRNRCNGGGAAIAIPTFDLIREFRPPYADNDANRVDRKGDSAAVYP